MKKYWFKKAPLFIGFGLIAVFGFAGIVMLLWNGILPGVLHISAITYWQALGILVLSKILFSGFRRRHHMASWHWKKRVFGQWQNMSEEEKENFKSQMQACKCC